MRFRISGAMVRNEHFLEEWSIAFLWSFGEGMVVEDVLMSVSCADVVGCERRFRGNGGVDMIL